MAKHIVVIPGDGIGEEITVGAVKALEKIDEVCHIGLTFEKKPAGGTAYDLCGSPLPEDTIEAAKKLADWASSKDAMLLYGENFAITAQPGVAAPLANVPKDYEARLVKMDFGWAADNRARILAEWTKRYDGKTEKR